MGVSLFDLWRQIGLLKSDVNLQKSGFEDGTPSPIDPGTPSRDKFYPKFVGGKEVIGNLDVVCRSRHRRVVPRLRDTGPRDLCLFFTSLVDGTSGWLDHFLMLV